MLRGVSFRDASRLFLCAALACACAEKKEPQAALDDSASRGPNAATCPPRAPAPKLMPGTRAEQMQLEYWLGRYSAGELDAELMTITDIDAYNRAVGRAGDQAFSQRDLL